MLCGGVPPGLANRRQEEYVATLPGRVLNAVTNEPVGHALVVMRVENAATIATMPPTMGWPFLCTAPFTGMARHERDDSLLRVAQPDPILLRHRLVHPEFHGQFRECLALSSIQILPIMFNQSR